MTNLKTKVITNNRPILLGKSGENEATLIKFPINVFFPFVNATSFSLVHQRHGDVAPYPCVISQGEGFINWSISSADVAKQGNGVAQLTAYNEEGLVAKTVTFTTVVTNSLGYTAPPEPQAAWVDDVVQAGRTAHEGATQASEYASQAAQSAEDAEQAKDTVRNMTVSAYSVPEGDPPVVQILDDSDDSMALRFGIPTRVPSILYSTEICQLLMHVLDNVEMSQADAEKYREPLRELLTPNGYIAVDNYGEYKLRFNLVNWPPRDKIKDYDYVKSCITCTATYEDGTKGPITDFHVTGASYSTTGINLNYEYMGQEILYFTPFPSIANN